jgi:transcriptional regulator with XRE-family HTH domain
MVTLWLMDDMQTIPTSLSNALLPVPLVPHVSSVALNIGGTIRAYRLQKGMSQGDIEKRTGLLRCYLSRVETGHTVPSLETLQKIAFALDLQLAQFFSDEAVSRDMSSLRLSEEEIRFLTQIQRYASRLSENDRKLLLAMVRKFAQTTLV